MITGSEDISIGGEDVQKARSLNVTSKSLRFAHKFVGGESSLNLGSLIMPSEISTWSNPSPSEIASANLLSMSANLVIKSSTGAELMEGVDFVVTSNSGLSFINGYTPQPGEIIVGRFSLPASSIVVADTKEYRKTVAVTAGQTIVSVGFEYKVNQNPTQQIGDIRVNLNGMTKLLRNVGNVTASPLADGNYEEYDPSGSGYSTAIRLNNPILADGFMIFEGGLALASADVKIFGALDRLGGIVTKLAEDAAQGFYGDNDLTRYLTASASEMERKTFGDLVLNLLSRLLTVESVLSAPLATFPDGYIDIGIFRAQWGAYLQNVAINTNLTVTLAVPFADSSFKVFVQASNQSNMTFRVSSASATQFNSQTPVAGTPSVHYLAIGPRP